MTKMLNLKQRNCLTKIFWKKALADINGYSSEPPIPQNRNTFVSAGLKYQELIDDEKKKYTYHFRVTSSENTLRLIDPSTIIKATATYDTLKNYVNKEVELIKYYKKERTNFEVEKLKWLNSQQQNKAKSLLESEELMDEIPEF